MNSPFFLSPVGKDYLWGGSRLKEEFNKDIDMVPLAETWECTTHPDGPSIVRGGEYDGMSLTEVIAAHPEYLGIKNQDYNELPIMIKFIDANKDLSVQVHPDDDYAMKYENGQLGKTEMWYVLDATEDARLIYGLNNDSSPEILRKALDEGTIMNYLQSVPVRKNDIFFVKAGIIHAIGGGALIAEIQESSNLTYRLYDYDRCDAKGNRRELHIDKALRVANMKSSASPRQPLRVLRYSKGVARELLCRCKYFEVNRMIVNTEKNRRISYQADELSFSVLLCIEGNGQIELEGKVQELAKGDCIFFPASSHEAKISGCIEFLDVRG